MTQFIKRLIYYKCENCFVLLENAKELSITLALILLIHQATKIKLTVKQIKLAVHDTAQDALT